MEIKDMTIADIEAREAEMKAQIESAESEEQLNEMKDSLTEERTLLSERKAELKDLEERKAMAKELESGKTPDSVIEERKEERKMAKIEEYRNSKEYVDAYAEYIKTGDDTEVRALLTTNVGAAGEVAVPDFVYEIIKTDWLNQGIIGLVKKINAKGNMKVQFELSAGDAVVHDEGSGAVSEEALTLGVITLVPESIKKWISVSDEVMDMTGESFLRYIYSELAYKIAVKIESILLNKIAGLSTSASENAVAAKKVKAGAALGTIATALGELNAEATNPVVVMNPATKAAFKAAAYSASFPADVFEGLTVYLTNALPAISAASENDVYAIVGDFGFGALANFPNGDGVDIKIDDKTEMTKDLVRILGREYVAVEPIANRAFVNITKPAAV